MGSEGLPGRPGKAGRMGAGGAGGAGGTGGEPSGTGGAGGRGGMGGAGEQDYATGRRRFRSLVMMSLVLSAFAVFLSAFLFARVMSDSADRRDQECRIFEAQHETVVERLKTTYSFLSSMPPAEYGTNLTVAVLRGLSDLEARARGASVPPHCDEDDVGLPEPNPKVPERQDFSRLLNRP